MTLTNISGTTWSGWSGAFSMPATVTVTNSWGATLSASGGRVNLTPVDYNATVSPGASATLGFQAATATPVTQLTGFTVNAKTCRAA
jgi:cellulase/cellobiase CelA1